MIEGKKQRNQEDQIKTKKKNKDKKKCLNTV